MRIVRIVKIWIFWRLRRGDVGLEGKGVWALGVLFMQMAFLLPSYTIDCYNPSNECEICIGK